MAPGALSKAEELRKAKKYAEAEPLFREAWSKRRHPDVAWRLAHCLRHLGKPDEALKICEVILEEHPEDVMARREAIWAVYTGVLRPAIEKGNLASTAAAANRMLALGADELALKRAVFSVVKVAKAKRAWREIIDWTDKLQIEELDKNPRRFGDQSLMPELEQWYFARIKALVELRLWAGARETAESALAAYPGHRDFGRWGAMALAALGEPGKALEEIRQITRRERAPYILDTLASIAEEAGETQEAFRATCHSLLGPGKLQTKIRTIERFARLALTRDSPAAALRSASLALAIREQEGWSIRMELEDLLERAQEEAPDTNLPDAFRDLLAACRKDWAAGRQEPDGDAPGTVTSLPEGRPFCFIRTESGQDIFTSLDLLPESARRQGARVRVWWVEGFDRKKKKPALQAIRVAPAERRTAPPPATPPEPDDDFRLDL
ncbi:MAG: tetratricopeptide repeat protein [Acidobacteriota bacterium]|nr:tetratricopeptide repeat protein [Acidobacteriota bacterium]